MTPVTPETPETPETPTPTRRRIPVWGWLGIVAVIVLALIVFAAAQVIRQVESTAANDPRSTRPSGAAALSQLLRDEGVDVDAVTSSAAATGSVGADTTLLVIGPGRLGPDRLRDLLAARPARLVLVAPSSIDVAAVGADDVGPAGRINQQTEPGCADPAATRAGAIFPIVSPSFEVPEGAVGCYPTDGGSAMVVTEIDGVPVTIIPAVISNETLPVAGNAALAMNVLGQHRQLVWLMGTDEAGADSGTGPGRDRGPDLVPSWWAMLVLQLLVGLVTVGLWRGRRLGPIIYEQLPVKITSAETIEGHGRLYQRQQSRDAAAAALRTAARHRLAARYGHPDDVHALAEVVGTRTGRDQRAVHDLLAGPEPQNDQQLLDLKITLDALEQEARQP